MKAAYADPPYPGCAHMYREEAAADGRKASEVDHRELIERLSRDYDAWALSTNSVSLREVLALCPPDVRVMAWVKPFASFKPNVNPAYAWEPVIVRGSRKRERHELTVPDFVIANITMQKGVPGAKPRDFCLWVFQVLGLEPGDEFSDLYPGSGAVSAAWADYCAASSAPLFGEEVAA